MGDRENDVEKLSNICTPPTGLEFEDQCSWKVEYIRVEDDGTETRVEIQDSDAWQFYVRHKYHDFCRDVCKDECFGLVGEDCTEQEQAKYEELCICGAETRCPGDEPQLNLPKVWERTQCLWKKRN